MPNPTRRASGDGTATNPCAGVDPTSGAAPRAGHPSSTHPWEVQFHEPPTSGFAALSDVRGNRERHATKEAAIERVIVLAPFFERHVSFRVYNLTSGNIVGFEYHDEYIAVMGRR